MYSASKRLCVMTASSAPRLMPIRYWSSTGRGRSYRNRANVLSLISTFLLFATLAASYDVVIGYTGIVSFGHAMYFGIGAYAVALALGKLGGVTYGHLGLGFLAGILVSAAVAAVSSVRSSVHIFW